MLTLKSVSHVLLISSLLAWPLSLEALQAPLLKSIEILIDDPNDEFPDRRWETLSLKPIVIELVLGEEIEEATILLTANADREFKIEQRYETALTVADEGPHLDLIDWKHYYSPWQPLKRIGKDRFQVADVDLDEPCPFPSVTAREIRSAVASAGGKRWAALVRTISGPNDYPCSVGVSKISLRMMVKEQGVWCVIHRLDFIIPMGC